MESTLSFFDQLVRLQIELWNAVDERLRVEHELRLGSFQVMQVVARGECRVNDIADDMVITIGGASKLVDRLEASGRVVRRSNPDDRRSSLIALTPLGTTLFAAATATAESELAARLGSPTDLTRLTAELTSLRGSL